MRDIGAKRKRSFSKEARNGKGGKFEFCERSIKEVSKGNYVYLGERAKILVLVNYPPNPN
jgi:hypothetical protein